MLRPPPPYGAVRVKVGRYIPYHIESCVSVDHLPVMGSRKTSTCRALRVSFLRNASETKIYTSRQNPSQLFRRIDLFLVKMNQLKLNLIAIET